MSYAVYHCCHRQPTKAYIGKNDLILRPYNFHNDVKECIKHLSSNNTVGVNFLRKVADHIGGKYDPYFNCYKNIIPCNYAGRVCSSFEDVVDIVKTMFDDGYPQIYKSYIKTKIMQRSEKTIKIYYIGKEEDVIDVMKELGIEKAKNIKEGDNSILLGIQETSGYKWSQKENKEDSENTDQDN